LGWLDLPVGEAQRIASLVTAWTAAAPDRFVMVHVNEHNDDYLASRAGRDHPLHVGMVEVAGHAVLRIGWDPGDHSMRHRGERAYGPTGMWSRLPS
jgi:hypothetical protein